MWSINGTGGSWSTFDTGAVTNSVPTTVAHNGTHMFLSGPYLNYVQMWNPTTKSWNALGTGWNGIPTSLFATGELIYGEQ